MKNVTILALGMLITQLSFAQGEFRFGLKGSMNLGYLGGTSKVVENDGVTAGFSYGVMGDYYFEDHNNYGFSAEILISTVKSKFNLLSDQSFVEDPDTTVLSDLNYAYKVQYLEIPLSFKFRTKEIGNMTYWGNFGVAPGLAMNAHATITSANLPDVIKDLDPVNYRVNDDEGTPYTVDNFDDKLFLARFPLIIGGGVGYKMAGSTSIQGGIRYSNA
ncbi:MAG: porin family protein, partial [Bacteroidia bacterium]